MNRVKKKRRCSTRKLSLETVEPRIALSVVGFTPHDVHEASQPRVAVSADLDGDGDLDSISVLLGAAGTRRMELAWYENTDGKGTFGGQQLIAEVVTAYWAGDTIAVGDIDTDGDMDIVISTSEAISWHENTDGKGSFSDPIMIASTTEYTYSIRLADIDGDDRMDVVWAHGPLSSNAVEGKGAVIAWSKNLGAGHFAPTKLIEEIEDRQPSMDISDLDGDGDLDLVYLTFIGSNRAARRHYVHWVENTDGLGTFGEHQEILSGAENFWTGATRSLIAADLDGDGDAEVLTADTQDVRLYNNDEGTFTLQESFRVGSVYRLSMVAKDFDNDDDTDIVITDLGKIGWLENNGTGSLAIFEMLVDDGEYYYATTEFADLDSDGQLDILWANSEQIAWSRKSNGEPTFQPQQTLARNSFVVGFVELIDVDGDHDLDILTASFDRNVIAWHENLDGTGTFAKPQQIALPNNHHLILMKLADLNGDTRPDIVTVSFDRQSEPRHEKISWFANQGNGAFGQANTFVDQPRTRTFESIEIADIDSDGDHDVVLETALGEEETISRLVWYENANGEGEFSEQKLIVESERRGTQIAAADFDGDGDLDLYTGRRAARARYQTDGSVVWYPNDGAAQFGEPRSVIGMRSEMRTEAADMDGDGTLDIVVGSRPPCVFVQDPLGLDGCRQQPQEITWHGNQDGNGAFGDARLVAEYDRIAHFEAADIDGDGDADIVAIPKYPTNGQNDIRFSYDLVWNENVDGHGDFVLRYIANGLSALPYQWHNSRPTLETALGDIDNDGDTDLIAVSEDGKIEWYEQETRIWGDSNRDGVFDSTDLVVIFQAGKYEDDIANNATFEEGDWNGDGDFDSGDLVMAFQVGSYVDLSVTSVLAVDSLFTLRHDELLEAEIHNKALEELFSS